MRFVSARAARAGSRIATLVASLVAALASTSTGCFAEPPPPFDVDAFMDPLAPGPYGVHEEPFGRATLFLPTTTVGVDPSLVELPLVVFMPGFSSAPSDFTETARYLAGHGVSVFTVDHGFGIPSALACETQASGLRVTRAMLHELETRVRTWSDPLFGVVDVAQFATSGHSYGGKLALWLALIDERVTSVFAIDPVDGGGDRRSSWCVESGDGFPRIATVMPALASRDVVLLLAGRSGDCAPAADNARTLFEGASSGTRLVSLDDATHTDFLDQAGEQCVACGLCPETATDPELVKRYTRARAVAFIKGRMLRDVRYRALADGEGALAEAPFDALVDEEIR